LEKVKIRHRKTLGLFAAVFLASAFFTMSVKAAAFPNLPQPPMSVTLTSIMHNTLFAGPPPYDTWYIDNVLSDVPSGFDVENGTYTPAWCVDRPGMTMASESPAYLFSSYALPPQADYPLLYAPYILSWNKINYILNNIPAGATTADIQQAIWAFCAPPPIPDPTPTPLSDQMVTDANSFGGGFIPRQGQVLAVICYPVGAPENDLQITIIGLLIPIPPPPVGGEIIESPVLPHLIIAAVAITVLSAAFVLLSRKSLGRRFPNLLA